jgi:hypothetical protein
LYCSIFFEKHLVEVPTDYRTYYSIPLGPNTFHVRTLYNTYMSTSAPLPDWIFDVYDTDIWPEDEHKSLLEELEIDFAQIVKCLSFVVSSPIHFTHSHDKQVAHNSNPFLNLRDEHHHDFWGPCLVVSMYAFVLSLGRVYNVTSIYIIWLFSSLMLHLTCRTWMPSTFAFHCAIIGYSTFPFVPVSLLAVVFHPTIIVSEVLTYTAIGWASWSAIKTYRQMTGAGPVEEKRKTIFLVFCVVLAELYFSSLLPMIM